MSGTASVGPLTLDTTYSLDCSGTNGSALAMTAVTIQRAVISWTPPTKNSDGSALKDLAGYRIRYGNSPGSYTQSVTVSNASATQWSLALSPGTWYFVVTAMNAAGNESSYSNEATKTIN